MNATQRLRLPAHAVLATIAAAGALSATGALAQSWPAKPIRLIVPFAPGGGNDIVARTMNIRLPALLGQPVIASIIGWVAFDEILSLTDWIGMIAIGVALVLVRLGANRLVLVSR
jgi:tripartite-type tricarboxylate transporter receptor subunit TctC